MELVSPVRPGQTMQSSRRANVFRCATNIGHALAGLDGLSVPRFRHCSASGSAPRPAPRRPPRSCHKPDAIGHDQKSVGEAHQRRQRLVHLVSETNDSKRSEKQPETAPGHKRCPSQPVGQQKLRFAAGEASVNKGERNRRAENGDKSGYAVQVADDDGLLDGRKDARDKKSRADHEQPPPAKASSSHTQARPEREGEEKRGSPQNAEGKRHQEPIVAKLVFADQMARVQFRLKNVEH